MIREDALASQLRTIIEPTAEAMGFAIVRIRFTSGGGATLQIMAERFDGTMAIEDCEAISRAISPVLEVEDPIDRAYHFTMGEPNLSALEEG